MGALEATGAAEDTWVIFTSDNGPWLNYGDHAGSAGDLREGKGSAWEGGVRVPCIMRWPGQIPAGQRNDSMLMTIDMLPTMAGRIGAALPEHPIDGKDVWPLLIGEVGAKNSHEHYFIWYENNQLQAVISGDGEWKLQLPHSYRKLEGQPRASGGKPVAALRGKVDRPELYHLSQERSERRDVAKEYPEQLSALMKAADGARQELGDSLTKVTGAGVRESGRLR
jgi:arylsulfatase A